MQVKTLLIIGAAACGASQRPWKPAPEQLAPAPALSTHASGSIGPLALEPGAGETPWAEIQRARRIMEAHYLDLPRIREETTTFGAFLDAFFQPLTAETQIGFEQAKGTLALLEKLAPYSVYNITLAFQQSTQRLHLCILNAGMTWPCHRDRQPRQPTTTRPPPFEIGEAAPGIGLAVIRDLRDAGDPAWRDFAAAARRLESTRGLVIDMREATGADPRALLPWVAALSGHTSVAAPLRAIERPDGADAYVDAYRARFSDRGRDLAVWSALVADGDAATTTAASAPRQPLAIVVGPYCESACELITRMLETHAGAVVVGGVTRAGRLARDEPALLVLPHSQTSVYFYATRYLLAADIEAATGPTEEWHALGGDGPDPGSRPPGSSTTTLTDHMTFAIRDVAQRIQHPAGWPRCDSLPVPAKIVDDGKLHGVAYISGMCPQRMRVTVHSDVPASALRRFLATCAPAAAFDNVHGAGFYTLREPAKPTPELLSRIAASDLVKHVAVDCESEPQPL